MNKELFALKDFRLLLSGQSIAVLGDWFGVLAIIALAGFRWQVTPVEMSFVVVSLAAPMLFSGPLGGVIADRVDRGRMLAVVCVVRAALLYFIAQAASFNLLIVLLLVLGTLDASFSPAKNAKLKEIPPASLIDEAVIYSSFIDQGARVFGPATAGFVLSLFGIETALYINAVFYLAAALIFTLFSPTRWRTDSLAAKESFWAEFKAGFNLMKITPFILAGALIQVFVVFTLQIVDSQFVILLRTVEGAHEGWLGYCLMASGLGTILMTYFYVRRKKNLDVRKSMFWGTAIYSASVIGIGGWSYVGAYVAGFLPFFLLWGASGALIFVKFTTYLQANIPVNFSGRVFGTLGSMMSGASIAGIFCGGLLVATFGAANTFVFAGLLMFTGNLYLGWKMF